jgi:D-alanyl-D-alanine carboxypeptidase/D-alanyl-D-alanine-endopeptidase (penicillin-binding protein 4)
MRPILTFILLYLSLPTLAQNIDAFQKAFHQFKKDAQLENAIIGLVVTDASTGKTIFTENPDVGLAPASAMKVITAVTAYDLLGADFTFKTQFHTLTDVNGDQYLWIEAKGDPVLGSHRWNNTQATLLLEQIRDALVEKKVNKIKGILFNDTIFDFSPIPNGWIWEDIGNYFGAGAWGFNWKENQFKVSVKPGNRVGVPVTVERTEPEWYIHYLDNKLLTGESGSGDNSILYSAPFQDKIIMTGTIGMGKAMSILGSMPNPYKAFYYDLQQVLGSSNITVDTFYSAVYDIKAFKTNGKREPLFEYVSPQLRHIQYWFLQKSVNLFGEVMLKTIAISKGKKGLTNEGVDILRKYWQNKGFSLGSIQITDGSGLSPSNRVTAQTLVRVLQYAREQSWFNDFYDNLPTMNGIKMKSGYIRGVRSYTGFIQAANGKTYTFAFIVNNFTGNSGSVREKMWKLLDVLK